jgi:hypothetical protein
MMTICENFFIELPCSDGRTVPKTTITAPIGNQTQEGIPNTIATNTFENKIKLKGKTIGREKKKKITSSQ